MRQCVYKGSATCGAIAFASALLLSGCAAPDLAQPAGKLSDVFATPEWAKPDQARAVKQRAVTQNDLLTEDGRCAAPPEQVAAAQATDGAASAAPEPSNALAGQGPLPALPGGVALGMTECEVVQRTGAPDTFNISAEGNERIATVTVTRGSWPGLYRFRGGRLVSMERVEVPAAPKQARSTKAKAKKTSQTVPLRGAQQ